MTQYKSEIKCMCVKGTMICVKGTHNILWFFSKTDHNLLFLFIKICYTNLVV